MTRQQFFLTIAAFLAAPFGIRIVVPKYVWYRGRWVRDNTAELQAAFYNAIATGEPLHLIGLRYHVTTLDIPMNQLPTGSEIRECWFTYIGQSGTGGLVFS